MNARDLDLPTIIRVGLWEGGDVDETARDRFRALFVEWVRRVTSGEIYWR